MKGDSLSLDCSEVTVFPDQSLMAFEGVLAGFEALILHAENLADLHGPAKSNDEVVSRIDRFKALACQGVALARRHMGVTLH